MCYYDEISHDELMTLHGVKINVTHPETVFKVGAALFPLLSLCHLTWNALKSVFSVLSYKYGEASEMQDVVVFLLETSILVTSKSAWLSALICRPPTFPQSAICCPAFSSASSSFAPLTPSPSLWTRTYLQA